MRKFSDFDYKNARNDWNHAEITFIAQISKEILIFILFYNYFVLLFTMTGEALPPLTPRPCSRIETWAGSQAVASLNRPICLINTLFEVNKSVLNVKKKHACSIQHSMWSPGWWSTGEPWTPEHAPARQVSPMVKEQGKCLIAAWFLFILYFSAVTPRACFQRPYIFFRSYRGPFFCLPLHPLHCCEAYTYFSLLFSWNWINYKHIYSLSLI